MIMTKNTIACLAFWRKEILLEDLVWLPVRAAFIIMMRSNLLGEVWTYRKLGDWFGITGCRVQQIEQSAIARACYKHHNKGTRSDRERDARLGYRREE